VVNERNIENMLKEYTDTEKRAFTIFCFTVKFTVMILIMEIYSEATNNIIQIIDQIRHKQIIKIPFIWRSLCSLREYGAKANILDINRRGNKAE
jgi:hypothetical protein